MKCLLVASWIVCTIFAPVLSETVILLLGLTNLKLNKIFGCLGVGKFIGHIEKVVYLSLSK